MRQTISVWADNLRTIPFNFFSVCSDKSVAQDVESDYAVGSLWQMDLPVTTDSHQAKAVISKHIDKPLVVFSTYQSSDVFVRQRFWGGRIQIWSDDLWWGS